MSEEADKGFEEVKERLDEIVEAVNDESLSLDDALDLYEEAVKLGMQASSMLEENIGISADASEEQAEKTDVPVETENLDTVGDSSAPIQTT